MARTWLSVSVELLGGRGEDLWPYPGRLFAVGPAHTFADLADAINTAFARWDRSHLNLFDLADGSVVTNPHLGAELTGSGHQGIVRAYDIETTKVARAVRLGDELKFTFDLGDDWVHRCVVGEVKVDPMDVLGARPKGPLAYWGWGDMPDQYGRRTSDDDGESPLEEEPSGAHPMRYAGWPELTERPLVDIANVHAAVEEENVEAFLDAVAGKAIDDALQQLAAGLPMALERARDQAEPVTLAVYNLLTKRGWPGDSELAEDLLARLRRVPLDGKELRVDLGEIAAAISDLGEGSTGVYVDRETGRVHVDLEEAPAGGADLVARDRGAPGFERDSQRWVAVQDGSSRAVLQDMADFAERQNSGDHRARLEAALEGKGAFFRFRDVIYTEGLGQEWDVFATDRLFGRIRAGLAQDGVRVR